VTPLNGTAASDITTRLHPALRHLAEFRTNLSADVIGVVRKSVNERRRAAAAVTDVAGVEITDHAVTGSSGNTIPVRIYRGGPAVGGEPGPAVLYCHGGAFVLGNLDTDHVQCVEFARRAECVVVSVDYRLAPEHPYPAGFDDALGVLEWMSAEAEALGVDVTRFAVAGNSAGGALAASLAQRAAAVSAPAVVFQMLHQPVLDDRLTPSKQEFAATPGFDSPAVEQMWAHYWPEATVPSEAVPAAAVELSGLPAAFITCSELDPLRDEAIDYAMRLMWAAVPTELHVFPGTCHGFDSMVPQWETSRELFAMQGAALRRAFFD
jgi:acetyl esterase